jgi:hypothetical protein
MLGNDWKGGIWLMQGTFSYGGKQRAGMVLFCRAKAISLKDND